MSNEMMKMLQEAVKKTGINRRMNEMQDQYPELFERDINVEQLGISVIIREPDTEGFSNIMEELHHLIIEDMSEIEKEFTSSLLILMHVLGLNQLHGTEDIILATNLEPKYLYKRRNEIVDRFKKAGYEETFLGTKTELCKLFIDNSPKCPTCKIKEKCDVWISANKKEEATVTTEVE